MEILLTRGIEALLLPPGGALVLAAIGLFMLRRWRRAAIGMIAVAWLGLYAFSIPVTAQALMGWLETDPVWSARHGAQAIVVLGAGRYSNAPEYEGDTVSTGGLERLRYAARLHKRTGLPLLLSGGDPFHTGRSEAALLQQALAEDFHINAVWLEERSRTTAENALFTQALLKPLGIRHVVLVTHAWHMPRAARAFRHVGLRVTPAPTRFSSISSRETAGLLGWLPRASALETSNRALHELLGELWYGLRR